MFQVTNQGSSLTTHLVTLYSAVFAVLFSESAQMIMNILGASFFSLVISFFGINLFFRFALLFRQCFTLKSTNPQ